MRSAVEPRQEPEGRPPGILQALRQGLRATGILPRPRRRERRVRLAPDDPYARYLEWTQARERAALQLPEP